MKRAFLLAALVALLSPSGVRAVDTEDFKVENAQDLVDVCSTAETDEMYAPAIAFCHGYAVGAWQYYLALKKEFVCPPEPLPGRQAVLMKFVAWAKSHPQYMKESAAQTLFKFLKETYPCGKK